jgi:hypothetical protein
MVDMIGHQVAIDLQARSSVCMCVCAGEQVGWTVQEDVLRV